MLRHGVKLTVVATLVCVVCADTDDPDVLSFNGNPQGEKNSDAPLVKRNPSAMNPYLAQYVPVYPHNQRHVNSNGFSGAIRPHHNQFLSGVNPSNGQIVPVVSLSNGQIVPVTSSNSGQFFPAVNQQNGPTSNLAPNVSLGSYPQGYITGDNSHPQSSGPANLSTNFMPVIAGSQQNTAGPQPVIITSQSGIPVSQPISVGSVPVNFRQLPSQKIRGNSPILRRTQNTQFTGPSLRNRGSVLSRPAIQQQLPINDVSDRKPEELPQKDKYPSVRPRVETLDNKKPTDKKMSSDSSVAVKQSSPDAKLQSVKYYQCPARTCTTEYLNPNRHVSILCIIGKLQIV